MKDKVLSFPDLDFDIKSKNVLLKSAKWLLNKKVKEKMIAAAVFNLNEELDLVKNQINTALNKEYMSKITLSGTIDKIDIKQISLMENELLLELWQLDLLRFLCKVYLCPLILLKLFLPKILK